MLGLWFVADVIALFDDHGTERYVSCQYRGTACTARRED